jgi:hypothetical protein
MIPPASQKGFSPLLLLVIVAVVGVAAYFGLRSFFPLSPLSPVVENPSPTPVEESGEPNSLILQDIVKSGTNCDLNAANCRVDKVVGNYAKGTMPMAYWIAEKTSGVWKVVITGNGIPQCGEVDKYSVPKEIYGNCIESSGQLRY